MRQCILCDKALGSVYDDERPFQVNEGGEVILQFCYGSRKFDNCIGVTEFRGLICDDCAEKLVPKMQETRHDLDGQALVGEDFERGARRCR